MDEITTTGFSQVVGNSLGSYQPYQSTCPNCGYCKHCGRSNSPFPKTTWTNYQTGLENYIGAIN